MMYYIFDTIEQAEAINSLIVAGESIGDAEGDITKRYMNPQQLTNGKYGVKQDGITSKYILDRQAVDIPVNNNII